MECRRPADLGVADSIGRLGLDELAGDAFERVGVLHERDRKVEGAEELGLVGGDGRGDQRGGHPGVVAGGVDPAGPGQLEGGLGPQ